MYKRHLASLPLELRQGLVESVLSQGYGKHAHDDESQVGTSIGFSFDADINVLELLDEAEDDSVTFDPEINNGSQERQLVEENNDQSSTHYVYSKSSDEDDDNSDESTEDLMSQQPKQPLPSVASFRKKSSHTNHELQSLQKMSTGTRGRKTEGLYILDVEALRQNIVERNANPVSHDKATLVAQLAKLILPQVASADNVVDDTRENPTVSVPQSSNQSEASCGELDDETFADHAPPKENPTVSVPQSSNQNEASYAEMDDETADDASQKENPAEACYAEMDDETFVNHAQSKQHPHSDDDLRRLLTLSKGRSRRKKNGFDLLDIPALKRNIEARGGKTGNE